MPMIYLLFKQILPETDCPWIICSAEHPAYTPVIHSFYETEASARDRIIQLETEHAK